MYGGPTPPPYGYGSPPPPVPGGWGGAPGMSGGMPPPPPQSFFSRHPMLVIRLVVVVIVVGLAIAVAGFGILAGHNAGKNQILFDSGNTAAHVFVDGKDKGEVAAGGHTIVTIDNGAHLVEAKDASGKVLEKANITLPEKGFRGAFRFAKARPIVRVSEIYGHAPDAIVKATPIMENYSDDAFTAFPPGTELSSLDTAFLDTIQMGQHEPYRIVWKVCHYNKGKRGPSQVSCASAPIPPNDGH